MDLLLENLTNKLRKKICSPGDGMKMVRKKYVLCDLTGDSGQAYILNNQQMSPESFVPQHCLKRQAEETDFFVKTPRHQVNVLIGEESLKFSCHPPVEVEINGKNISCQK